MRGRVRQYKSEQYASRLFENVLESLMRPQGVTPGLPASQE